MKPKHDFFSPSSSLKSNRGQINLFIPLCVGRVFLAGIVQATASLVVFEKKRRFFFITTSTNMAQEYLRQ